MSCIPDASPLIVLSKLERTDLLSKLYGEVMVTPKVWEEAVITGKAMGAADAAYLERVARELQFTMLRLTTAERALALRLTRDSGIGLGEAEVLAVASLRNALAILDDKDARTVAVGINVAHVGTVGVIYEAFLSKLLSYQGLLELLERLGGVAWIAPDIVAGIIRRAREVNRE